MTIGLILGVAIGFGGAKVFAKTDAAKQEPLPNVATPSTSGADSMKWPWPDSLDAIVAAPHSHQIIYEDKQVRILHVTVAPGQTEPVHSHKWRSIAWASQSPTFTLYHYVSGADKKLTKTDSFSAQLPLNTANKWDPEAPHAVRNTGKDTLVLYRVEFKK